MFWKDKLKHQLKSEKGLSLIELLAVIIILGIIAAIAIPTIGNVIANTRAKAVVSEAIMAINASNLYFNEHTDETEVTYNDLIDDGFLEQPNTLTDLTITKGPPYKIAFNAEISGNKTMSTGTQYYSRDELSKASTMKGVLSIPRENGVDEYFK